MKYEQMVSAHGCGASEKRRLIPGLNKTHIEREFLSAR